MIAKPALALIADMTIFVSTIFFFTSVDTGFRIIWLFGVPSLLLLIGIILFLKAVQVLDAVNSEMDKVNEYLKIDD